MNPGQLNCRVVVKQATETRDSEGNIIIAYADRFNAWAKIQAITARVREGYADQHHEVLHRITIRYNKNVAITDRIHYGSRVFALIGPPINVDEKNAYLRLECREVVEVSHG